MTLQQVIRAISAAQGVVASAGSRAVGAKPPPITPTALFPHNKRNHRYGQHKNDPQTSHLMQKPHPKEIMGEDKDTCMEQSVLVDSARTDLRGVNILSQQIITKKNECVRKPIQLVTRFHNLLLNVELRTSNMSPSSLRTPGHLSFVGETETRKRATVNSESRGMWKQIAISCRYPHLNPPPPLTPLVELNAAVFVSPIPPNRTREKVLFIPVPSYPMQDCARQRRSPDPVALHCEDVAG